MQLGKAVKLLQLKVNQNKCYALTKYLLSKYFDLNTGNLCKYCVVSKLSCGNGV